jgi:CheY-like chemotaxis protein/HPt (histidine-containing phosphotransfer) domain-containing protein
MQKIRTDKRLLGRTILVAEDVVLNQHLTRYILESSGASVVIANNGSEALDWVKRQYFDCILMDVQMPEMDGIEATEQIRLLPDPEMSATPIIALTANCHADDLLKYERAGMDDFLAKPFDEALLLNAILSNAKKKKENVTNTPARDLYDLSMIRSVSGGDPAFIKKMILLFIETVPQNVKELVESTAAGNWEQVSKMAHKLKSTVDSMGIKSIHDDIRKVEASAKALENLDLLPGMVKQVENVVSLCIRQLHKEVN